MLVVSKITLSPIPSDWYWYLIDHRKVSLSDPVQLRLGLYLQGAALWTRANHSPSRHSDCSLHACMCASMSLHRHMHTHRYSHMYLASQVRWGDLHTSNSRSDSPRCSHAAMLLQHGHGRISVGYTEMRPCAMPQQHGHGRISAPAPLGLLKPAGLKPAGLKPAGLKPAGLKPASPPPPSVSALPS